MKLYILAKRNQAGREHHGFDGVIVAEGTFISNEKDWEYR